MVAKSSLKTAFLCMGGEKGEVLDLVNVAKQNQLNKKTPMQLGGDPVCAWQKKHSALK